MSEILIDGVWRPCCSGKLYDVENPATLERVAAAAVCGAEDVALAEDAARRASVKWCNRPIAERKAMLHAVGRELAACDREIAELQALESGQAWRESLDAVHAAANSFMAIAGEDCHQAEPCKVQLCAQYPLLHWAHCSSRLHLQGATLTCIAPWETPLAVLRAARCAGSLPAGVHNLVVGSPESGKRGIDHGLPARGTDTVFVSRTSDRELAQAGVTSLRLYHSGQRPGQSTRIYVDQQIVREFADELHTYLAFLECGDPRKPATDLGPLRTAATLGRVADQVGRALKRGALLKMGGRQYQPWGLPGHFFQPTLLVEGPGDERAPDEEIRGPVMIISPVKSLAEALRLRPSGEPGRVVFFGQDLESALRSVSDAGIEHILGTFTPPLTRLMESFSSAPRGPLRIEPVTVDQRSWFPYQARNNPL